MKALLIDAGNTRIRMKVWPAAGAAPADVVDRAVVAPLEVLAEYETADAVNGAPETIREATRIRNLQGTPPTALVSVVPSVTGILTAAWPDLVVVDHRGPLPFETEVEDPAAVGADRLCNVAAAAEAGLSAAIIVDAGTATTFDVLVGGVFRGGLIAPGMAFAAQKLGESAARLDPVPFEPCLLVPGRSTREAMAAGAWHTGIGGVETVIAGLLEEFPAAKVIATGGLGRHLAAPGRIVDTDWTLRGAAVLAGWTAA